MNRIYPSTYYTGYLNTASDLFKYCAAGDIVKVKSLLEENENIYQEIGNGLNIVPMFVALNSKNMELVNELLIVYERDLEALKGETFKSALIARPEDQTDEFLATVQTESSNDDDFIPVILKNNNNDVPKCVFLRKKLKHRNDLSLRLAKKLAKNGSCDLNWQVDINALEDSFLHLAIHHQMKPVISRILSHPTVEKQAKNSSNHTPLHYALFTGNLDIVNILLSTSDYGQFYDDPSYLYQAALSGKQKVVDLVIDLMMKSGKSLPDILDIPFSCEDYNGVIRCDYLLHVLVKNGSSLDFSNKSSMKLDERDFCKQNSNGDTVLHQLVLSPFDKLNATIKLITGLARKFPKLLLIENKDHQLPLHYAAFHCTHGQRLYKHMLRLTVQESGNPDVFHSDPEAAVATLEEAILSNNALSGEYLKNFEKLLQSHGPRLLHKIIQKDKKLKTLKGTLSTSVKLNPNDFYEGTNAFLLINYDTENQFHSTCGQEKRLRMLHEYHQIEDPNARDTTETTLFMYIVGYCEDNDFIRSMIKAGADCRAKNLEGLTCLHHAATNTKNKEIIQVMLEQGVNHSALTLSKKMAIHYAIQDGILDTVKVLLPLMSDEQLTTKMGKLNETLIQVCMRSCNGDIVNTVWNHYEKNGIIIDVNSRNDDGDNLPMIALSSGDSQHLDLIFSKFFQDIDFSNKNNKGETFFHKATIYQQVITLWKEKMFDKYPKLYVVMNEHMNMKNTNGDSPMDNLAALCQYLTESDGDYFDFFIQQVTVENLQVNFHMFFKCPRIIQTMIETLPNFLHNLEKETYYKILESASSDVRSLDFILNELSSSLFTQIHDSNDRNILHLVCEKNEHQTIDFVLKTLSDEALKKLEVEVDGNKKTPYEYLSADNQSIFANCFI